MTHILERQDLIEARLDAIETCNRDTKPVVQDLLEKKPVIDSTVTTKPVHKFPLDFSGLYGKGRCDLTPFLVPPAS